MAAVAGAVADWSGGTRLGVGLKDFLDRHGQGGMARGAIVVVASGGWERGGAALLGIQWMQRSLNAATPCSSRKATIGSPSSLKRGGSSTTSAAVAMGCQ